MKTVPSVYSPLINTSYLSHSTQVAEGNVFRDHMVYEIFYCLDGEPLHCPPKSVEVQFVNKKGTSSASTLK